MKRTETDLGIAPFDVSDYLDSDEVIAEYLLLAIQNEDPNVFLAAVRDVAKARGIKNLAERAGVGRESLYKTLRPGAKPQFETMRKLLKALGVSLTVVPNDRRAG